MDCIRLTGATNDGILDAVAVRKRRLVLWYLIRESPNQGAIDNLTESVVANTSQAIDYETVQIELYHKHLPKLADRGLIDYDWRSGEIRYHSKERVESLLEALSDD